MFVVIVDFHLEPGYRESFRHLVDANARTSFESEKKCRRFDVLEPNDEADRIILYEIYDNEAAFLEHVSTRHYESFETDITSMVRNKFITQCQLVCEGDQLHDD